MNIIDQILTADLAGIIGQTVNLKKRGNVLVGLCPFHQEKTGSFTVFQKTNTYKCFGCGKAGNAITFIKEQRGYSGGEAVKELAKMLNLTYTPCEQTPEEIAIDKHREALFIVNQKAAKWYHEQLFAPENAKALEYARSRWDDDTIKMWQIGYAPDTWDGLKNWAAGAGIKTEILLEAGLLAEKNNKVFDVFRGRIMIPMPDKMGHILAFSGRDITGSAEAAKYINTKETAIYKKGSTLFGIMHALIMARQKETMHLVEGHPDVIRLHTIGKHNTVGTCGTALTKEQAQEIAKYVRTVTIIGDTDKAGQTAVEKNGEILIRQGLFVNVITLPDDSKKMDPDSFFTSDEQFDEYANGSIKDYLLWIAERKAEKAKSADHKARIIDHLSELITFLPDSYHTIIVEKLGAIVKPKKAWQDKIKSILKETAAEKVKEDGFKIPESVTLSDFDKYGFYADNNCYWFRTKDSVKRGTNFTMQPLFHVASVQAAKRLYRIINEFNFTQVIEVAQRDMINLSAFKLRVESLGNFLFEATEAELNKLKRYLYEQTQTCYEITQLGWQKAGFWAWGNGVFNHTYHPVDVNGIVELDGKNYYLPAYSAIYKGEDGLFINERKFIHKPGGITLHDFQIKFREVFGPNADIGIMFFIASLFRDHIYSLFGFYPILNLFGPKGAGKTAMAVVLLQFFGNLPKGPNLTNTSKPALADHVAQTANACCHIDEYKNSLEYEKIEFIKGLWDGTGRTRMNMDKDKKKETTAVDAAIIISGQEMPTADVAAFSRMIFLTFSQVEYTDEEKMNFKEFEAMYKKGLTHITCQILTYREQFVKEYQEAYNTTGDDITTIVGQMEVEDRIYRNWLTILAAYRVISKYINLPFTYDYALGLCCKLMQEQNKEIKRSNEVSIFWSIVQYLSQDGQIQDGFDYKVSVTDTIKTDVINEAMWPDAKTVLFLNHTRVFQLYRRHGLQTKESILPIKTLDYYITHSPAYLGKKNSVRFKKSMAFSAPDTKDYIITTAYCFDYKKLGIEFLANVGNDNDTGNLVPDSVEKIADTAPF